MKRYHWVVGIGPRVVSLGSEDEESAAVDAIEDEVRRLIEEDTPGLWAKVEDVTQPFMWPNPPTIGWKVVFSYRDPRTPVDDPATQELKGHLQQAHNMIEARSGTTVTDEVVYDGALGPEFMVQLHDWVHKEGRFSTPEHDHE